MAQASQQENPVKNKPSSDEDYSFVQASSGDSILRNSEWPQQNDSNTTNNFLKPSLDQNSYDSQQIHASHYALATAYARVTKKLAEAEKRNILLQMNDSFRSDRMARSSSGNSHRNSDSGLPFDIERRVNEAWEAYNEKCKECEALRDEVAKVKQNSQNSDHHSRIQDLKDDVLRERAKQDDVVRKLEKSKMEADHSEKKEILAREELEKEREYQISLIRSAEVKHRELEQRIQEAERNVIIEKNRVSDMIKKENEQKEAMLDNFRMKEEEHNKNERRLEEKIIRLQEEVSVLVTMQSTGYSGTSHPSMEQFSNQMSNMGSAFCDIQMPMNSDLQAMMAELNELKTRAAEQSHILQSLLNDPKMMSLLQSGEQHHRRNIPDYISMPISSLNSASSENDRSVTTPIQCNDELKLKHIPQPKSYSMMPQKNIMTVNDEDDVRQVIGSSMPPIDHNQYINPSCDPTTHMKQYFHPTIPQMDINTSTIPSTVVYKPTEDFIRNIGRAARSEASKPSSDEFNPVFPPVNVSRVIHVPSTSSHTIPPQHATGQKSYGGAANANNNFNPTSVCERNIAPNVPSSSLQTASNSIPIPTDVNGISNYFSTLQTMPTSNDTSKMTVRPGGAGTLIPTNPFYNGMTKDKPVNALTNSIPSLAKKADKNSIQRPPEEFLHNLNSSKMLTSIATKNILDGNMTILQPPLQFHKDIQTLGETNQRTPTNRYLTSDEDDDSGDFHTANIEGQHQPKEFVVAKVVHASTLAAQTQNKAFHHENRPTIEESARLPIRARSEFTPITSQSTSRNKRPERNNGQTGTQPGIGIDEEYNENKIIKCCPICNMMFEIGSTENSINRHINAHFSDEEDGDNILIY